MKTCYSTTTKIQQSTFAPRIRTGKLLRFYRCLSPSHLDSDKNAANPVLRSIEQEGTYPYSKRCSVARVQTFT